MADDFDKLFADKDDLDRKQLVQLLEGNIILTPDGEVRFLKAFNPKSTILLYLLARKVLFLRAITTTDREGPQEIHRNTGLAEGTVKRYVRELENSRLLAGKDGRYWVPNHALLKINELVQHD